VAVVATIAVTAVPGVVAEDDAHPFVFSAPPWEEAALARRLLEPVAELVSERTGLDFEYRHQATWLGYVSDMLADELDLVFDEPHFVAWRTARLGHEPLARIRGGMDFVVVARRDDPQIVQLVDLAGFTVCGRPPPDLSTLLLLRRFANPAREPRITVVDSDRERLASVLEGRCRAAPLARESYLRYAQGSLPADTRILSHSGTFPRRGFSASGRLPDATRRQIAEALLSAAGAEATRLLRERFAGGLDLVPATGEDYRGLESLLDTWWPMEAGGSAAIDTVRSGNRHE
jgi:ABC-type phosphate/phosphonate transport system substrate-binding protein